MTERWALRDTFAVYVWRSVWSHGDTKARKSRRPFELPAQAAETLCKHLTRQATQRLSAGEVWEDNNLVFCTRARTALDAANVRRGFQLITAKAGIGKQRTPRELRHSFVSIMSSSGVALETIADLVRHAGTAVTEKVYRHQLRPVITRGASTMNTELIPTSFGLVVQGEDGLDDGGQAAW